MHACANDSLFKQHAQGEVLLETESWSLPIDTCNGAPHAFPRQAGNSEAGLWQVPPNYDSLLGKLIVWGEDRTQAIARMQRALNEMVISGVTTTIIYHTMLLDLEDFKAGNVDTGFIPNHADELKEPPPTKPVRIVSLVMICHCLRLVPCIVPCQCVSMRFAVPCLQQVARHADTAHCLRQ